MYVYDKVFWLFKSDCKMFKRYCFNHTIPFNNVYLFLRQVLLHFNHIPVWSNKF